jgi:hypothetical protein
MQNLRIKQICNESNESLQMTTLPNSYLGRHPPSADGNNVGAQQNVVPPLNNNRKIL